MSLLIDDNFNTIENIEEILKDRGLYSKLEEMYKRGIKLTPIQANMLLLDYPNFGGRAYGKSYMKMIVRFEREAKKDNGYQFVYCYEKENQAKNILEFQREYYPEFDLIIKEKKELLFRRVR